AVPFSLMYDREAPVDYLTAVNSEMETQILPENWTENGIMFSGSIDKKEKWNYQLGIVNGLDGSAFNSANWIKRGNQKRFELINAENFAVCGRMDFRPKSDLQFGISLYAGNTTDNRPKPDLKVSTTVALSEFHFNYEGSPFLLSGQLLYGA